MLSLWLDAALLSMCLPSAPWSLVSFSFLFGHVCVVVRRLVIFLFYTWTYCLDVVLFFIYKAGGKPVSRVKRNKRGAKSEHQERKQSGLHGGGRGCDFIFLVKKGVYINVYLMS